MANQPSSSGPGASTPPFLVSTEHAAALSPDFPALTVDNIKEALPRLLQEVVSPGSVERQQAVRDGASAAPLVGSQSTDGPLA